MCLSLFSLNVASLSCDLRSCDCERTEGLVLGPYSFIRNGVAAFSLRNEAGAVPEEGLTLPNDLDCASLGES